MPIRVTKALLCLISPNPPAVTKTPCVSLESTAKHAEATDGVCKETVEHECNFVSLVANADAEKPTTPENLIPFIISLQRVKHYHCL